MRNKVLLSIALLLIFVSASLFTYPEVSKQVAQGQNDVVISRFDKTTENVQGDDGGKDGESDDGRCLSKGFRQAVSGQRCLQRRFERAAGYGRGFFRFRA